MKVEDEPEIANAQSHTVSEFHLDEKGQEMGTAVGAPPPLFSPPHQRPVSVLGWLFAFSVGAALWALLWFGIA